MTKKFLVFILLAAAVHGAESPGIKLREWQCGIAFEPRGEPAMSMYLWFYEWTLFGAVRPGEHTPGFYDFHREVGRDGSWAVIRSEMFELHLAAAEDGADLSLHVTNITDHDWPEVAAIIPCFNPGREGDTPETKPLPGNRLFADEDQQRTWFLGPEGPVALVTRAIHFRSEFRREVDEVSPSGKFVFSEKWPTSPVNAHGGLIIRESTDGRWVTGVSWDDYMSVQGHNPWYCMHHSIRVGALKRGESKVIRGKIYLFRGNKDALLAKYRKGRGD